MRVSNAFATAPFLLILIRIFTGSKFSASWHTMLIIRPLLVKIHGNVCGRDPPFLSTYIILIPKTFTSCRKWIWRISKTNFDLAAAMLKMKATCNITDWTSVENYWHHALFTSIKHTHSVSLYLTKIWDKWVKTYINSDTNSKDYNASQFFIYDCIKLLMPTRSL
jgi:hypothetical protein